jgi:hypothetical protein
MFLRKRYRLYSPLKILPAKTNPAYAQAMTTTKVKMDDAFPATNNLVWKKGMRQ